LTVYKLEVATMKLCLIIKLLGNETSKL